MYATEVLVLKRSNAGEADTVFSLYTRDFGKIRAVAQGVRKEGAKLRGHLEPLLFSTVGFVSARHGYRLTHALLIRFGERMHTEPERMLAALTIAARIDDAIFEGEKDDVLWNFLVEIFNALEHEERFDQHAFLGRFENQFSHVLGYGGRQET